MQTIEQALHEVRALHERLVGAPAPDLGPDELLPFPAGVDPLAFAVNEVAQLQELVKRQPSPGQPAPWTPRANVFAGPASLRLALELAGVTREDVSVTVEGGELTVRGSRRPPTAEPTLEPALVEHAWGPFEWRFPVPPWCQAEQITARCVNGVLEIRLTRADEGASRKVEVDVA